MYVEHADLSVEFQVIITTCPLTIDRNVHTSMQQSAFVSSLINVCKFAWVNMFSFDVCISWDIFRCPYHPFYCIKFEQWHLCGGSWTVDVPKPSGPPLNMTNILDILWGSIFRDSHKYMYIYIYICIYIDVLYIYSTYIISYNIYIYIFIYSTYFLNIIQMFCIYIYIQH